MNVHQKMTTVEAYNLEIKLDKLKWVNGCLVLHTKAKKEEKKRKN